MDELEDIYFGRSSLYNPKDDNRYKDLTKVQEDFNFAEEWNKGTTGALARDNQRQSLEQRDLQLKNARRDDNLEEDLLQSLANTTSPEEVEDVLRQVAIRNGSTDLLDKIEVRKNRKQDQALQEINLLKDADQGEAAAKRVLETFGVAIPAEKLKKDPKIIGGGYILGEDGVATPIPGIKRTGPKPPSVTVFDQRTGSTKQVPAGSVVPPGYSQIPPTDKQLVERSVAMKLMEKELMSPKSQGKAGRPSSLASTPKKVVSVRERPQ